MTDDTRKKEDNLIDLLNKAPNRVEPVIYFKGIKIEGAENIKKCIKMIERP